MFEYIANILYILIYCVSDAIIAMQTSFKKMYILRLLLIKE